MDTPEHVPSQDVEQARRDLMRQSPDLYRYIAHYEAEKALDVAGDVASGAETGHGAANRVYALAAHSRKLKQGLRK